jgi:hypothetical protein
MEVCTNMFNYQPSAGKVTLTCHEQPEEQLAALVTVARCAKTEVTKRRRQLSKVALLTRQLTLLKLEATSTVQHAR